MALPGHSTSSLFSSQAATAPQQQGVNLPHYGFRASNCQLQETHLKKKMPLLLSDRLLQPRGCAQGMVSGYSTPTPPHLPELQVGDFYHFLFPVHKLVADTVICEGCQGRSHPNPPRSIQLTAACPWGRRRAEGCRWDRVPVPHTKSS